MTKEVQAALTTLVKQERLAADPAQLALEVERLCVRVDLSRSAARMRRQFYAAVHNPMVLAGLFVLDDAGWRPRDPEPIKQPLGDIWVDHVRLIRLVRGLKGPVPKANAGAPVHGLHAFLAGMGKATQMGLKYPSITLAGTLLSMHLLETARRVKKGAPATQTPRHFRQWGLLEPSPDDVELEVARLVQHGFVKVDETGASYRLQDEVSWSF